MSLNYTIVDAFASQPFKGNPAAVIILPADHDYSDDTLQGIALEFNLSETAFITPDVHANDDASIRSFGLRWFTPRIEVNICGHATLASAAVLFFRSDAVPASVNLLKFSTRSGILAARRVPGTTQVELDFPAGIITPYDEVIGSDVRKMIAQATGLAEAAVTFVGTGKDTQCVEGRTQSYDDYAFAELDASVDLRGLDVDLSKLALLPNLITVISNVHPDPKIAYALRAFAPRTGVNEDPVMGSANTLIARYWAQKLGIGAGKPFAAQQVSSRGGDLTVEWDEKASRVKLRGEARVAAEGRIYVNTGSD